jgi:hypothetical protein
MGTSLFYGQKCLQYSATVFTDVFRKHRPRRAVCLTCLHCSACAQISFHSAGIFSIKVAEGKNKTHTYFVCVCVYVCMYIYIYIYIYTHTYIHTHTQNTCVLNLIFTHRNSYTYSVKVLKLWPAYQQSQVRFFQPVYRRVAALNIYIYFIVFYSILVYCILIKIPNPYNP